MRLTDKLGFEGYDAIDFERRLHEFDDALEQVRELFEVVRDVSPNDLGIDPVAVAWYSYDDQLELVKKLEGWRKFLEFRDFIFREV